MEGEQRDDGCVNAFFHEQVVHVRVVVFELFARTNHDGFVVDEPVVPRVEFRYRYVLKHYLLADDALSTPFIGVIAGALFVLLENADADASELLAHAGKELGDVVIALAVEKCLFKSLVQSLHVHWLPLFSFSLQPDYLSAQVELQ